jgi:hypothetical protein
MVFSPIVHCHEIADRFGLPGDFSFWKDYNERMLSVCDALCVLMLDGWSVSPGVNAEIIFAQSLDKPIIYCTIKELAKNL